MLVYRIVRSPERRVFHIEIANTPPDRGVRARSRIDDIEKPSISHVIGISRAIRPDTSGHYYKTPQGSYKAFETVHERIFIRDSAKVGPMTSVMLVVRREPSHRRLT